MSLHQSMDYHNNNNSATEKSGYAMPVNVNGAVAMRPRSAMRNARYYSEILDASTSSSVAIDNKIEQAMDLVKSHLMFAVREEVEVLKEKIGELMEKINSLECENNVLRQYAPPDALLQLQQAPQQQTLPSNLPHHTSS